MKVRRKLTRRQALAGLGSLGLGVIGFGAWGSRELRVDRRELRLERWDADGFRLVQVSDVHINDAGKLAVAQQAITLAVAEKPDLIVFTGDFVNFSAEECLANIEPAFEGLRDATCPCLAILGNHDYWCSGVSQIIERAARTPLKLLRNEVAEVQGVTVVGLDDALVERHDPTKVPKSLASKSLIALLHEPDFVVDLPDHVSLTLSGHSHGGEICLPGGIPLYTPEGSKKYQSGFYDRSVPLFVSHGTATLGPARTFCPAEINVLTLRRA